MDAGFDAFHLTAALLGGDPLVLELALLGAGAAMLLASTLWPRAGARATASKRDVRTRPPKTPANLRTGATPGGA